MKECKRFIYTFSVRVIKLNIYKNNKTKIYFYEVFIGKILISNVYMGVSFLYCMWLHTRLMPSPWGFVYTQVQITCTNQLLVADTPPQPVTPPVGTLTDTLMSPPQSSGSTNRQIQHTDTIKSWWKESTDYNWFISEKFWHKRQWELMNNLTNKHIYCWTTFSVYKTTGSVLLRKEKSCSSPVNLTLRRRKYVSLGWMWV